MLTVPDFFDLTQTNHADIFDDVLYPWEVVERLAPYLEYSVEQQSIHPQATVSPQAVIGDHVVIGEGTIVEPFVVIKGPVIIGKECVIRSGAYIRENVLIGDRCVIGNSSEVKNALLFHEVNLPHFNYVGDSILGYHVNLGGGALLTNTRIADGTITIVTIEQTFVTGLAKLGAIIGDQSSIGSGAVTMPGALIGKRCMIYPQATIRGVVANDSIVKVRQQQEVVLRRQQELL